jgi:Pregnancy-associated plasma protein-A
MIVHRRLLNESTDYRDARASIESSAFAARTGRRRVDRPDVDLPVVVHVVHNTGIPEQNISDDQIHSQIDVLNADFQAQNSDIGQVPSVWTDRVGNPRIRFHLATTDPDGNATDGIVRQESDETSFGLDDGVKSSATGGSDPWPTDRYLNLWVCQLSGGLLGYAQFPGGAPETDGVVILHTAFGNIGTASAPFDLGRTATHEVGHWLNLFHIWGDDGTGCNGTDEVDDTPNQGGENTGMPTFPSVSCGNGPDGDMFVNYMDYTDDAGMFMFTSGQVLRMDACLLDARSSFLDQAAAPA